MIASRLDLGRVALPAAAFLLSATAGAATPYWLRDWSFGAVAGPKDARASIVRTGARHLALHPGRVVDPLSEGCANGARYDDIRHRSRTAMVRHFGAFWKFPATLDAPGSVAGWVRCNRSNVAAVAFVDPHLGYRFFEDGIVITLH